MRLGRFSFTILASALLSGHFVIAQTSAAPAAQKATASQTMPAASEERPRLIVMLVVDQMRGDYVDKFQRQWNGGLKRLVQEGAWFREAAYPYAETETCVGHATISTGSLPATHGMIANSWWDRESQKTVTCTADPNVTNIAYGGGAAKGGDSAWRMRLPAFADELRFQGTKPSRVVSLALKARSAITMAGHKADAAVWFDGGSWETSPPYGPVPFIETFVKSHPVQADYGKTWSLSLAKNAYAYDETPSGAVGPAGWGLNFPHTLSGKSEDKTPDQAFLQQWATSPFADTYVTKLAEEAVDQMGLGRGTGTDFLAIGYSTVDYVGHSFGPHSWEIQDILIRLDKDLGDLLAHLDAKVGRGNYVVALSADHGVVPTPEDMRKTGADAGTLYIPAVQEKVEKSLEPFNVAKPAIAHMTASQIYFSPGVYDRLKSDANLMRAVLDAIRSVPGVAEVYRAEDLQDWPETQSPLRSAEAASYFAARSGDLFIVPKPYWLASRTPPNPSRDYGTSHGTPYYYDQHVPVILMGWGIQPGEYFGRITPADIAPTLATLCGIALASSDGRVLAEALQK